KTVEEARDAALQELSATEDDEVEIEVLDEGSKGVFGLGQKMARVKITLKGSEKEIPVPGHSATPGSSKARKVIVEILDMMDLGGDVTSEMTELGEKINVAGSNLGVLIGKHGQTLDSLQYLLNLIVNKGEAERSRIILDIEGYRQKREMSLQNLALRMAEKAVSENKNIVLEPMMPGERRIIHLTLQDNTAVSTFSQGEEPLRKVVIAPRK
ncbi:MAG: protein jag, partial [Firmicutes bacterium]|nr:protein jag [Bacillota bacterium]